jgi:hypothetical protein
MNVFENVIAAIMTVKGKRGFTAALLAVHTLVPN